MPQDSMEMEITSTGSHVAAPPKKGAARRGVWLEGPAAVTINVLSVCTLLLIGWLDYITGYELGFFIFYFIPVSLAAWYVSRTSGLFMACASAATWYFSDRLTHHPYSHAYLIYWEMWMRLISFITTAATVAKIRGGVEQEKSLRTRLLEAEREIEKLKALVRDDDAGKHEGETGR